MTNLQYQVYDREYLDQLYQKIESIPTSWTPKRITDKIAKTLGNNMFFVWEADNPLLTSIPLIRARSVKPEEEIDESDYKQFSYPPRQLCTEMGRANRKRQQVFYASSKLSTACKEIESKIILGKSIVYISHWEIKPVKEFCSIYTTFLGHEDSQDKLVSSISKNFKKQISTMYGDLPKPIIENFEYGLKKYQSLFTNGSKEFYHITSAIAHDKFVNAYKQGANIPIICYPSIANSKNALNWAIRKDFTDKYLTLKSVDKVVVKNIDIAQDGVECLTLAKAEVQNNILDWKKPFSRILEMMFDSGFVKLRHSQSLLNIGTSARISCCPEHHYNIKQIFEKYQFTPRNIIANLSQMNLNLTEIHVKGKETLTLAVGVPFEKQNFYLDEKYDSDSLIEFVGIPIKVEVSYR